ncbi:CYTH and CHAD domain-containing protein [Streptomyces sp. ISL-66]|uniref:CYTH and CHAD domain-containing protein n=1 Tax=Streptomyces sp. ISL-66 TaxID=2819186 RepID=UPI001BE7FC69|nr:CYTH and CHAD domain-containing protein [Streptomyces sp. ISL-66]MBT2466688.1 CYTH and CHAD domain-containing protein [Streptomyces sp. ISL-66]
MADTKREIERKFEFSTVKQARRGVPDLTGTADVAAVTDQGTVDLDAVYYDTHDQRLAADGLTLRRRTGGKDAGWHLKLPVSPGVRDEITAALSDTVPRPLAALLRSRIRDEALEPQVRLLSSRKVSHLLDVDGALLAELSTDAVRAERAGATAAWTEVEVELADGVGPELLDAVEKKFRTAGLRVCPAPSKLARALAETSAEPPARAEARPPEGTTGAHVLAYLREQRDTLIAQDPAVRRGLPDSVHRMRVATRRLRSAFKTYRRVLDPDATGPIREELRWLAGELGVDRDQEVLLERIQTRLGELPVTLQLGPVRGRLKIWNTARRTGSRRVALAALDSRRYVALLNDLDALLADPPLLKTAGRAADAALPAAVIGDYERLAGRVEGALAMELGPARDLALHDARKAAKRARYAAEAATPVLGKPAKRLAKSVKAVQSLLGDHQDSVVAREALRGLAVQAAGAGESSFTWGVLYAREEALSERRERELPEAWEGTKARAGALRG